MGVHRGVAWEQKNMKTWKAVLLAQSYSRAVWRRLTGLGGTLPLCPTGLTKSCLHVYVFIILPLIYDCIIMSLTGIAYKFNLEQLTATLTSLCARMRTHTENVRSLGRTPVVVNMSAVRNAGTHSSVFISNWVNKYTEPSGAGGEQVEGSLAKQSKVFI